MPVVIEDDWDTSCVRNWPNCMNNKLYCGCGRSASCSSSRDTVRALGNGDPSTANDRGVQMPSSYDGGNRRSIGAPDAPQILCSGLLHMPSWVR